MTKEELQQAIKKDKRSLEFLLSRCLNPTLSENDYIMALSRFMQLTTEIRNYYKELIKLDGLEV